MAGSILVVLPRIDPTFSQCFWLRDVYVFDSSHLNSGAELPTVCTSTDFEQTQVCFLEKICTDFSLYMRKYRQSSVQSLYCSN